MNGEVISNAQREDSVILFFGQSSIGTNVNYSLYKKSGSIWSWLWFVDEYTLTQRNSTTRGYVVWKAISDGEYYFNMSNNNGASWSQSGNITVGSSINDESPDADITNAVGDNRYSVNYNINFTQESHDQDDLLNLTWNFSDGNNVSFYSYSLFEKSNNSLLGNSAHAYTLPGKYLVKLTATERNRSAYDVDSFDVLIFGPGVNVIPVITSPERMKAYGSRWIYANASQTYVVNCSVGPMPNYNFTTIDGGLYCKYIHAPGAKATSAAYNLTFTWTMGDGRTTIGDLDSNYNTAVVFKYKYESSGLHSIGLNVRYIAL
jgi:hypothetical protein